MHAFFSKRWPLLLLTGLMIAQLWVQALWIRADLGIGDGVCCSFTSPIFEILLADGTDQLGAPWSEYRRSMGLLVWPALLAYKVTGANPDFLLWLLFAGMITSQVLLFDIGRRLAGPLAGVTAAGLFPMIPAVAYMNRRWDAMAPQHTVLLLAAWCLLCSRNFSRWLPTAGFCAAVMVGIVLSARETDNLLFAAAAGAMALGTVLRMYTARASPFADDLPPRQWRSTAGLIAVVLAIGVFIIDYAAPLVDFQYFADEMENRTYEAGASSLSIHALLAYPLRLYSDDLSPWLAIPMLVALGLFARRGAGRTEVLAWLVLPLLALSLVGKKNFYYAAVIYPAIPIIIGVGLARIPHRWSAIAACIGVLLLTLTQYVARSLPRVWVPEPLARIDWTGSVGPQAHLFQGVVPLALFPRGPDTLAPITKAFASRLTEDSCACPQQVLVVDKGDYSSLHLSLKMRDPCISFSQWPRIEHARAIGYVIERDNTCTTPQTNRPRGIETDNFELIDARRSEPGCIRLWARNASGQPRLCGSRGSPPS